MQKMFNIFQEEGEELSENAKLWELFKQVQHPQLQDTVKALKMRFDIEGLIYTQVANHLSAPVSELAEYQMACKVSLVTRICGGGNAPTDLDGIQMPNGTIYTGTIRIGMHYLKRTRTRCWLNGRREALTSLVTVTKGKTTSARWLRFKHWQNPWRR